MKLIQKLRARDNTGIVLRNTVLVGGIKGFSLIVSLLTMPAYMHFFDNAEILGLWFTLLSVLTWMLNCDMGIGNGLRNNLVYTIQQKDWEKTKSYISSAYVFLVGVGFVILGLVFLLNQFVNWNHIFNISETQIEKIVMQKAMIILIFAIVIQLILRLVTSILYALQEAFVPGLLNLITNVIMLLVVLFANYFSFNNDFILLAYSYLFAVNIPLLLATLFVFLKKIPKAKPSFHYFQKQYAFSILQIGVVFLWLQFVAMIVDNTNNYLITIFVGNSDVVEFQLYNKIFYFPMTLVMLLTTSLWSAITKAKAEGNWDWIASSYRMYMKIAILIGIVEFLLIIPLQMIFNLWLGDKTIQVNYMTAAIFALAGTVMSLRTILATYSNGLYEIKIQLIFMTMGAIANIPLAYVLSRIFGGYISIVIANIVSMLPYCIAQMLLYYKIFKKNSFNFT